MPDVPSHPLPPRLHARPATGWVNDPNGVGFWDGRWHVTLQHNPGTATWGDIRWAHLSSEDLVTWREEAPALVPRPGTIDAGGVWSGAVVHEGPSTAGGPTAPALVYTAIPADGGAAAARVAVARPDGRGGWHQPTTTATGSAPAGVRDVRDPFVLTWRGRRYGLQGGGTHDGVPLVLLYDAEDLDRWRYLGPLVRGDDPVARRHAPGRLWECPQLVRVEGTWVLLVSLWDDSLPGCEDFGPQRVAWLTGDLELAIDGAADAAAGADAERPRFRPTAGGPLDSGTAFYASQVLPGDARDRVLAWGWAWEGTRSEPPQQAPERPWAGALTFPRELHAGPSGVRSAPAREVLDALGEVRLTDAAPVSFTAPVWLARLPAAGSLTVLLGTTDDDHATATSREVWSGAGADVLVTVDGSVLEAWVDGVAATHRVYPASGEHWLVVARDRAEATSGVLISAIAPVVRR